MTPSTHVATLARHENVGETLQVICVPADMSAGRSKLAWTASAAACTAATTCPAASSSAAVGAAAFEAFLGPAAGTLPAAGPDGGIAAVPESTAREEETSGGAISVELAGDSADLHRPPIMLHLKAA